MLINQILVVKETHEGEGRVALTPTAVALLAAKKIRLWVEAGAGLAAGFSDEDYRIVGAEIFTLGSTGIPSNTLIVRVKRPSMAREILEKSSFNSPTLMMGFLSPFANDNHIQEWQALGVTGFSFELYKTLSIHDPKNVQAAMSKFAGRLALQDALERYRGTQPIKVTILGTGPAAFSAARAAKAQGLPVQMFGRSERYRAESEEAGITYYLLPEKNQSEFIRPYLYDQTIIITAARIAVEKAPLLIDSESLSALPDNTVIVDLSVSEGGNVAGSKRDHIITLHNGISIINISGYPKAEPREASEAYSDCVVNILSEIFISPNLINLTHPLLKECCMQPSTPRLQLNSPLERF